MAVAGYLQSLRSVPDLQGLNQYDAESALGDVGLDAAPRDDPNLGSWLPKDHKIVVRQKERPGQVVRSGDTISFDVEAETLTMPSLVNLTWQEFLELNKSWYFDPGGSANTAKPLYKIGSQTPEAGALTAYGSEVTLTLTVPQVEVPDLVGTKIEEVETRLTALGLEGSFDSHTAAIVTSQSIPPGSLVDIYTRLDISGGLVVPNLTEKSPDEANQLLVDAGIINSTHKGPKTLAVSSQTPAPGSVISYEDSVVYTSPKHRQVYRVESNGSLGSVTWGLQSIKQETETTMPWEHIVESDHPLNGKINLIAQTIDGTSITCKLIVDGKTVLEETSSGPYAVVSCTKF